MISADELDRLLEVCRKHGVRQLTSGGLSVSLGDVPREKEAQRHVPDPSDGIPPGADRRLMGLMPRRS